MSIVAYPLNNIDFSAEDVGIYNATRGSGIYAGDDFALSLTGADNIVNVGAGLGWMRLSKFFGVAVAARNSISVDMGLPDSVYPRIDAVVLQFDVNKNGVAAVVKKGVASSDPQPPTLSQTESVYELHLAHVRREPGATSISVANVTDIRLDPNYCGLMADAATKIDTSGIASQVYALIDALQKDIQGVKDGSAYLMRSGGSMTGELKMNGQPISGLNAPTANDQAANKGYVVEQVKNAAPYNHVDNGDFGQFVVQAPFGSSHAGSVEIYAGDRWILDSGTVTGEVNENGNGYKNITLNGTIRQKIANPPAVGTAGVEMISGTATVTYEDGEVTVTSNGGVIGFVKLFEGEYTADNMPKAQPNGYGAERLECMRYFQTISSNSIATVVDSIGHAAFACMLLVEMRVKPTSSIANNGTCKFDVYGVGGAMYSVKEIVNEKNTLKFMANIGTSHASRSIFLSQAITLSADL